MNASHDTAHSEQVWIKSHEDKDNSTLHLDHGDPLYDNPPSRRSDREIAHLLNLLNQLLEERGNA